ncbi:response regulator [uncultured Desulfuromonas sp.]|uniref:response regulator n=1 Tax=uncultured Desulfuromonas sp. TaxID=181013 RepID=UPI00260EF7AF|nr:response regulator [uncultured Desulfuromonas sp.]
MKRILIVDDEPHVLRVLRYALEREGYRIETARDGAAALKRIAEAPPDTMITDLMMPGMTGRQLCQELHRIDPRRSFPIWVMTSRAERSDREWMDAIPNLEFLEKPVSPRFLLSKLEAAHG